MTYDYNNKILNKLYMLKSIGYNYLNNDFLTKNEDIEVKSLKQLENIVLNCNLCSMSNLSKNKIFFQGNKNSNIVILNNNTFLNDKSYDLYKEILHDSLGIELSDIYFLNILKCDAKVDLNNYNNELDMCSSYSLKQIDLIEPKLIISIDDSYKYLTNEIYTNKNIMIKYKKFDLFISDNPNYILRNPSLKYDIIEQYKKLQKYINN